jgi:transposase
MDRANLPLMQKDALFPGVVDDAVPALPSKDFKPRLRRPDRRQVLLQPCSLEELLPPEHEVRTLWAVVQRLDLSGFYDPLKARGCEPGRAATDPQLLVGVWLWAATRGVGSAREIARRCQEQDSFRWLCGGVNVNHHTLSDFRSAHEQALDELFTQVLVMLMDKGLVKVKRISQDGLRVRAGAGAGSFKREEKLNELLSTARAQIEALKRQADEPDNDQRSERVKAAQERAAREREKRIEQALAQMPQLKAIKQNKNGKKNDQPPRASLTDPEARKMKMPDGGIRPAYNVQLATDTESRAIIGVAVSNQGTDQSQSQPMRQQVEQRTASNVQEHLMDGGFIKFEAIEQAHRDGVTIYAPPKETKKQPDPYAPREGDSPAITAWRQRMGTEQGQQIYQQRASTSETVNADIRCYRGLDRFLVRGLGKVRCVALWSALAYNLMHFGKALLR